MALLDTHLIVKNFIKHGFSEEQAEVIVEAINDQNTQLVTKNDLNIAILELKTELKSDIHELRTELKTDIFELGTNFKSDISAINTNVKWLIAITLLLVGILLKNTFI